MGNKTGKVKSFGKNPPDGLETISHSLSLDSIISTTTSQQCLLIADNIRSTNKENHHQTADVVLRQSHGNHDAVENNEIHCGSTTSSSSTSSLSSNDTLTINDTTKISEDNKFIISEKKCDSIVELDPSSHTEASFVTMPERIVRKLSPEEWNELVQIFSQSLEQSLKSTLPSSSIPSQQHTTTLTDRHCSSNTCTTDTRDYPATCRSTVGRETQDANNTCTSCGLRHTNRLDCCCKSSHRTMQQSNCTTSSTGLSLKETKERSATINCPPINSTNSGHHNHHNVTVRRHGSNRHSRTKRRPLSLPPNETITISPEQQHGRTDKTKKRKHYVLPTSKVTAATGDKNYDKKRAKRRSHHCPNSSKYITLAQLKELGLAFKTSDGLILGRPSLTGCYNTSSGPNNTATTAPAVFMTHSMEQLCYLGPTMLPISSQHQQLQKDDSCSAFSNMAVADYDTSNSAVGMTQAAASFPPSTTTTPATNNSIGLKESRGHKYHVHLHSTTSIKIENSYLLSTTEQ